MVFKFKNNSSYYIMPNLSLGRVCDPVAGFSRIIEHHEEYIIDLSEIKVL